MRHADRRGTGASGPLRVTSARFAGAALAGLALFAGTNGDAAAEDAGTLALAYAEGTIANPSEGRADSVHLRAYDWSSAEAPSPFVGAAIHVRPGDTLAFTLDNRLPTDDPSCDPMPADMNTPHCFNNTNFHSHGWWVSPRGNSDNVLLDIAPGESQDYSLALPAEHPAGTFWYHAHRHGSTALQVSSGMGGALIVEGDRLPTVEADGTVGGGDVDTLLVAPDGTPYPDRTLVLQQIAYACLDADGAIEKNADGTWFCGPDDVGVIESYDGFGPGEWQESGRFTSINGAVLPELNSATALVPERWRFIHAGVRDSIDIRFRRADGVAALAAYAARTPEAQAAATEAACSGDPVPYFRVAEDGLTRPSLVETTSTVMQPGYRTDLLIQFPEPGVYCVIDDAMDAAESINAVASPTELLGYVTVGPAPAAAAGADADTPGAAMEAALVASAAAAMPAGPVREAVIADLRDGLGLSAFVPHPTIEPEEVTGTQTLGFLIDTSDGVAFEIGDLAREAGGGWAIVDAESYDSERVDRSLTLGGVDEWTLRSDPNSGGHPFHIHVNPFQIVSVVSDETGEDVSAVDPMDPAAGQYAGLKGQWKDTLFVASGYTVTVRTRYERFTGEFVLHCHILDHEDQGMMQNVEVVER
ncbi:MAG: multicopper oxidase domain-containing protein [Azospirillaceae bacterium]